MAAVRAGLSVRERREDGSPGLVLLEGEGQVARLPAERSRPVAVVAVVAVVVGGGRGRSGAALVEGLKQMWKDVHLRDRSCGRMAVRI